MDLIICEKPSQGEDFGKALGTAEKKNNFIISANYYICWCVGHLFSNEAIGVKNENWNLDELPLFPEFRYKLDIKKKTQFETIKSLIPKADKIIIATDAAREGELIAREVLISANAHKNNNIFRFFSSEALTPDVIKKEINNLKPISNYDYLFFQAKARAESDWLVGINFTRFFTCKAKNFYSVGRVQTPTLKIIVNRDLEIENFKSEKYYIISALFDVEGEIISSNLLNKENKIAQFSSIDSANLIADKVNCSSFANLIKKESNTKSEKPRPLLSLTSLQKIANLNYEYSADLTLNLAQSLYEKHKCISYPRTDSNFLAESSLDLAHEKLQLFAPELISNISKVGKRVFDNSKLTDHHAIIPFDNYNGSDKDELNIFNLIKNYFIAAFSDDYIYDETKYYLSLNSIDDYKFILSGITVKQKGWKDVLSIKTNDVFLPSTNLNKIPFDSIDVLEKHTTPPKQITESMLLNGMEKLNLGTPATRASIIENIISKQYVVRNKKHLISTDKGKEIINVLSDSNISDFKYTSVWENKLATIKSFSDYSHFVDDIKDFVKSHLIDFNALEISSNNLPTPKMIKTAKSIAKLLNLPFSEKGKTFDDVNLFISDNIEKAKNSANHGSPCPCGKGTIKDTPKAFNCSCGVTIWRKSFGTNISFKNAKLLFEGKSVELKNCKSKSGKSYSANIKLDKKLNKLVFVF
jgi:DNA topoisomerase-3